MLLRKSASMMKETLDEEKQRVEIARAEKLGAERKLKKMKEKEETMKADLVSQEKRAC